MKEKNEKYLSIRFYFFSGIILMPLKIFFFSTGISNSQFAYDYEVRHKLTFRHG